MCNKESSILNHQPKKSFAVGFSVSAVLFGIMTVDYCHKETKCFLKQNSGLIRKMMLSEDQVWRQKWIHLLTETNVIPLTYCTLLIVLLAINEYCLLYKKES